MLKQLGVIIGLVFWILFASDTLYGACNPAGFPTPSGDCQTAPVVCLIDGFCSSTPSTPITPISFCTNNVLNNPSWFSFVGTSNAFVMDVRVSNCVGNANGYGVQVALYSGCPFTSANAVTCNSACRTGSPTDYVISISQAIVPNTQYWMVIDGCNGDVCDYEIDIISGIGSPNINITPGQAISAPDTVCPGQLIRATYPLVTHATEYQWTVNGTPVNTLNNTLVHPTPLTQPDGPYEICLLKAKNPCDEKDINVCKTVYIKAILPVERFDTICKGANVTVGNRTFNQNGDYSVTIRTFRGCDSIVNLHLTVLETPDTDLGDIPICKSSLPFRSPINNLNYNPGLNHKIILKTNNKWRCDSTIIFDVISLEAIAKITSSGVLDCGDPASRVILDSQTSDIVITPFDPNSNQTPDSIQIEWTKNGVFYSNKDTIELAIRDTGLYVFKYSVFYKNIRCDDTAQFRLRFNAPNLIQPQLTGVSNVCVGTELSLSFANLDPSASNINWIIPPPLVKIGSTNTNNVRIGTPAAANSVTVCAQQFNTCSTSIPGCIDITIQEAPELSITRDTNICQGGSARIYFTLLSGTLPAIAQFSNNTTMLVTGMNDSFIVSPLADTTITLVKTRLLNGLCESTRTSTVRVGVLPNQFATLRKNIEVCNKVDPSMVRPTIIDLDALILSGPTNGEWTNFDMVPTTGGRNNQNFTGITPGTYRFTYRLTGTNPCPDFVDTVYIQVSDCNCPSVALSPSFALCTSNQNVILNLTPLQTTTEMGSWSITNNILPNVSIVNNEISLPPTTQAGILRLTFTLNNPPIAGCLANNSLNVTILNPPKILKNIVSSQCNFDPLNNNGTIFNLNSLLANGSSAGTWKFNNMAVGSPTNFDFNGLMPGIYIFEYTTNTAVAPCQNKVDTFQINVIDCTCKNILTSTPAPLCNSNGTLNLQTLETNVPGPGVWSIRNNVIPAASILGNTLNVTGAGAGTIELQFKLNSVRLGCRDTSLQNLVISNQPNATVTSSVNVCNKVPPTGSGLPSQILNFTNLVNSSTTGSWSPINGAATSGTFTTGLDFTGANIGPYTYRYDIPASPPCANLMYDVTVNVLDCNCPLFTANNLPPYCNSLTTPINLANQIITSPSPYTFSILNNVNPSITLTGNSLIFTNSGAGNFSLVARLNNPIAGCKDTVQISGRVEMQPTASLNRSIVSVCNATPPANSGLPSEILSFSSLVTGGSPVSWTSILPANTTGTFASGLNFTNATIGTYLYRLTVPAVPPCTELVQDLTVNVQNCVCPTIGTFPPSKVLCNDDDTLQLNQLLAPGVVPGSWSIVQNPIPNASLIGSIFNARGAAAGPYRVQYKLTTGLANCVDTSSQIIQVEKQKIAGIASAMKRSCEDVALAINLNDELTGEDPGGNWTETSPILSINGLINGIFNTNNQKPGLYIFKYKMNAGSACAADSASVAYRIDSLPTINIGLDQTLSCLQNNYLVLGNNLPFHSYIWKNISTNTIIPNNNNLSISIGNSGFYELSIKNDSSSCEIKDTIKIFKTTLDSIVSNVVPIDCYDNCNGEIRITELIGNLGRVTGQASINNGALRDTLDFVGLCAGTYTIFVKDGNNCTLSRQYTLENPPLSTVELGNNISITAGESVNIQPIYSMPISTIQTISFTNGLDIFCSQTPCSEISLSPLTTTRYFISLTTIDGCIATDTLDIWVNPKKNVFIPNVFSPNGDGVNDIFKPFTDENVKTLKVFRIFNRWGDLIFERKNIDATTTIIDGWDGYYNGQPVQTDVYVYHIELEYKDGKIVQLYGDVTLTY